MKQIETLLMDTMHIFGNAAPIKVILDTSSTAISESHHTTS